MHTINEKFYRGINYFRGGPNISEIFGSGGPNVMGVQIFRYSPNGCFNPLSVPWTLIRDITGFEKNYLKTQQHLNSL